MLSASLALLLVSATPWEGRAVTVPTAVQVALDGALTIAGARVSVASYSARVPGGCTVETAEVPMAIEASGRLTVKLGGRGRDGRACAGWATVGAKILAPHPVTTRALRAGDPLDGAVEMLEREISGRAPAPLPAGCVAARSLGKGQVVEASAIRVPGLAAGSPIKVRVVLGTLAIEQTAKVVPCGQGRSCAALPSGRHIEGRMEDGQLVVVVP